MWETLQIQEHEVYKNLLDNSENINRNNKFFPSSLKKIQEEPLSLYN